MAIMKFAGPVFTLLMMLGSTALAFWFALVPHVVGGVVTAAMMAAGCALLVFKKDLPGFWLPLFRGKK